LTLTAARWRGGRCSDRVEPLEVIDGGADTAAAVDGVDDVTADDVDDVTADDVDGVTADDVDGVDDADGLDGFAALLDEDDAVAAVAAVVVFAPSPVSSSASMPSL
jgi:hypothetical protein